MEEQAGLLQAVEAARQQFGAAWPDSLTNYAAGAVAGSACITAGFPFDTVKVRLQNPMHSYASAWQCASSVVRQEGVRTLYRGMSPQLLGGMAETGVNFGVFHAAHEALQDPRLRLSGGAALPLAAVAAGAAMSVVLTPAELIKCRMQLSGADRSHAAYASPMQCLRHTVRTEGLRGLARGMSGTMARDVPGNAIYFSTYHWLRARLPGRTPAAGAQQEQQQPRSLSAHLADAASAVVCGGLAGMVMWSAVLPMDVAKTRMQTSAPGDRYDIGILRQLRLLRAERGMAGLYAGLGPALARAFPANAAQWLAWESVMSLLGRSG